MRLVAFTLALSLALLAQQPQPPTPEPLWPQGAPLAIGKEDRDIPTLTAYLPKENATGAAVVVCPGGGYGALAMDHEGKQIAEWLNGHGLAAFVLKYRLGPRYHHPAPLLDAQRALRLVRMRAQQYKIQLDRIGIWGFSAGGHLASTVGTHFDSGKSDAQEAIDRSSSRPDFMILAYPVITFQDSYAHKGSRRNLLGETPDPGLVEDLSNERRVTAQTPPTFLFHTNDDAGVPVENSLLFHMALRKAGVPVELHVYEHGRHGVGLAWSDPVLGTWPERLADWLRRHQWGR